MSFKIQEMIAGFDIQGRAFLQTVATDNEGHVHHMSHVSDEPKDAQQAQAVLDIAYDAFQKTVLPEFAEALIKYQEARRRAID
jgi:hypothetical protein